MMAWTLASGGRNPFGTLTVTDLFRLGSRDEPPVAWAGTSARLDGCHCRLAADRHSPEDQRGMNIGMQAIGPQDLSLRLTEIVQGMGLPARLVPSLLAVATPDWLDHAQPAWLGDWEAGADWPRLLSKDRVDEYLLFLVSRGALVASDSARTGGE